MVLPGSHARQLAAPPVAILPTAQVVHALRPHWSSVLARSSRTRWRQQRSTFQGRIHAYPPLTEYLPHHRHRIQQIREQRWILLHKGALGQTLVGA